MVPVEDPHFYLRGSGRELVKSHCRDTEVMDGFLWTREGRGHADIPANFDIQFDSTLSLRGCSWSHSRIGQGYS